MRPSAQNIIVKQPVNYILKDHTRGNGHKAKENNNTRAHSVPVRTTYKYSMATVLYNTMEVQDLFNGVVPPVLQRCSLHEAKWATFKHGDAHASHHLQKTRHFIRQKLSWTSKHTVQGSTGHRLAPYRFWNPSVPARPLKGLKGWAGTRMVQLQLLGHVRCLTFKNIDKKQYAVVRWVKLGSFGSRFVDLWGLRSNYWGIGDLFSRKNGKGW